MILKTFWPSLFGSKRKINVKCFLFFLFCFSLYLPNKRNGSCASPLIGCAVPFDADADENCLEGSLLPFAYLNDYLNNLITFLFYNKLNFDLRISFSEKNFFYLLILDSLL